MSTDTVLEIGPGQGALTEKLLATARIVLAVEKDEELVANIMAILEAVKPKNINKAVLASTMSPGVKLLLTQ